MKAPLTIAETAVGLNKPLQWLNKKVFDETIKHFFRSPELSALLPRRHSFFQPPSPATIVPVRIPSNQRIPDSSPTFFHGNSNR